MAVAVLLGVSVLDGVAVQAAPPVGTIQGADHADSIKDRYIVVLKTASKDAVAGAAQNLAQRYHGAVRRTYKAALHGFTVEMTEAQAKQLAADPAVKYVQQDRRVKLTGTQSNPPSWGLDRIDQANLPLSQSYTYSTTASNVHAYVIDTGIRISHTDFGGRASYGYDFVDNDAVADDCDGHGTHVAGTIGSTTYGVAKAVQLVAVRVLDCTGSGSYSQVIAGIDWVTANAVKPAVANMSLGGSPDTAVDDAVRNSIASGVTYAIAAGNGDQDACRVSPADVSQALTVGATNTSDTEADYYSWGSNWGPCVDLFAPGVDILSTWNTSDTATAWLSGTSMATPHVAGAAALVLAANPTYTPAQVSATLITRAAIGRVKNIAPSTPNRLLYTGASTAPAPAITTQNGLAAPGVQSAAVLSDDGTPQYFGRAPDNTLSWWHFGDSGFTTTSLGGSLIGTPHAVRFTNGATYVFGRSATGTLQTWWSINGVWQHADAGGSLAGDPVISQVTSQLPFVFGRGADGTLWEWYSYGGRWYGRSLGGSTLGDPTVAGAPNGVPFVFAHTAGNVMRQWYFYGGVWYTRSLGGSLVLNPSASPVVNAVPYLFGRGADGGVWQWYYYAGLWYSRPLGGPMTGVPVAAGQPDGIPFVFARSADNQLRQWYYYGGRWYTRLLGGSMVADPKATSVTTTVPYVVGRGFNGTNYYVAFWWYAGNQWLEGSAGGPPTSEPTPAGAPDAVPWIFWRSAAGDLGQSWLSDDSWGSGSAGGSLHS